MAELKISGFYYNLNAVDTDYLGFVETHLGDAPFFFGIMVTWSGPIGGHEPASSESSGSNFEALTFLEAFKQLVLLFNSGSPEDLFVLPWASTKIRIPG